MIEKLGLLDNSVRFRSVHQSRRNFSFARRLCKNNDSNGCAQQSTDRFIIVLSFVMTIRLNSRRIIVESTGEHETADRDYRSRRNPPLIEGNSSPWTVYYDCELWYRDMDASDSKRHMMRVNRVSNNGNQVCGNFKRPERRDGDSKL